MSIESHNDWFIHLFITSRIDGLERYAKAQFDLCEQESLSLIGLAPTK